MTPQQYAPLIGIVVAVGIILLRNNKPRTLRPQFLWVSPLIVAVAIGFGLWGMSKAPGVSHAVFAAADWAVLALGLSLGGLAGWWRGKMTTIEKHPDGVLKAQASPIGLILIVALMLGRRALSAFLEPQAAALGLNSLALTDAFMVFVVGMIVIQRLEMFLRAKKVSPAAATPMWKPRREGCDFRFGRRGGFDEPSLRAGRNRRLGPD